MSNDTVGTQKAHIKYQRGCTTGLSPELKRGVNPSLLCVNV